MKRIIVLACAVMTVVSLCSVNSLKSADYSAQELELAVFEKNVTQDQKEFLKEDHSKKLDPFKKIIFSNINELKNIYEYHTPEESQKLLFNAWLNFLDKNFEELNLKEIFTSDTKVEVPSESFFYPIISAENFKDLGNEEKKKRIVQFLYQARYQLKHYLKTSFESLKKVLYFKPLKKSASADEGCNLPSLQRYLRDLIELTTKGKFPLSAGRVFSEWLDFLDNNFEELKLKEIFPSDVTCEIPPETPSCPLPSLEEFKKLDNEEKRKCIVESLYQVRHELKDYFKENPKALKKVADLTIPKSGKIPLFYESFNIPTLKEYIHKLIARAQDEKVEPLEDQIKNLHSNLSTLRDKLSLLSNSLNEIKNRLVAPAKSGEEEPKVMVGPEESEESDEKEKIAARTIQNAFRLHRAKKELARLRRKAAKKAELARLAEKAKKIAEAEKTDASNAGQEAVKSEKDISKQDSKKLEHPTKSRPMGQAGRARPTRKPRVKKSDEQSQESEELSKKFEDYVDTLKIEWTQEQRALTDQIDRYKKVLGILNNKKMKGGIKKLSLVQAKVGIVMGKDSGDDILQILPQDLEVEIKSISKNKAVKIQIYKETIDAFEKIITLLKESDTSIDDKRNELQKLSNYFGPAKLSADDVLKIDIQKIKSSVSHLESLLQEFDNSK